MGHKARKARHVKWSWKDFIFAEWLNDAAFLITDIIERHIANHWLHHKLCQNTITSALTRTSSSYGSAGVLGMRFADNMSWIAFRWQHHLHLLRRGVNVTWITFKVNVVINMLIIFRWFESALCFWTANTKEQTKKNNVETAEVFAKESKVIPSHPLSSFTYFVYGHEQRKFTGKHVFMLIKYDHNISQKVFTNMMLTLQITAIIWPGMLLLLHSVRRCQMSCPTIAASMS